MKMRQKSYIFEWKEFLPGELVCPASSRCPLKPGVYEVISFRPPVIPFEETGIVFVEGHIYGVSAEYLCLAQDGKEVSNDKSR